VVLNRCLSGTATTADLRRLTGLADRTVREKTNRYLLI
jgi:hypothetical protein